MEQLAYLIFVLIVCIVYTGWVRRAKLYGRRLRLLRENCKLAAAQEVDKVERKTDGITTIVIDKAKDASLLPGSEDDDVSIWTQSKSTKANEIAFLHVPDLQNISSHMVAVYKIETPAFAYLTYMTT